ncbi:hypothetical protein ACFFRR_001693 [Megaselia abdita]
MYDFNIQESQYENTEVKKVEVLHGKIDTRKLYQHVKRIKEGYAPPTVQRQIRNLLLRDYFAELLIQNKDDSSSTETQESSSAPENVEDVLPRSLHEISTVKAQQEPWIRWNSGETH